VSSRAVCDAGPLIHLGELDRLDLFRTFEQLYVPKTVQRELEDGGLPAGFEELEYRLVGADSTTTESPDLDSGEAAALALAAEREAILLTDDLEARERATESGVAVHGSIGIIVRGYARGRLDRTEATTLIRQLQLETSLRVRGRHRARYRPPRGLVGGPIGETAVPELQSQRAVVGV
jgi:predicted nucleic acid-binding protein